MTAPATSPSRAGRIFISYSHRGNGPKWKAAVLRALHVFEQHHLLDVWEDGKIRVSADWNDNITEAMASAGLAVFLLTPEALESQFILERELPFLRDRWQRERIPVFPVVCEPCRWKEQEQSKWLHAIQSPAGAEPLSSFPDAVADRHLRNLATAIAQELSRAALAELSSPSPPTAGEGRGEGAPPPVRTYLDKFPLTRGPGLREEKLIGREQELALLDLAFASSFGVPPSGGPAEKFGVPPSGGPGSRVNAGLRTAIVSLVAWGGVGKTMLVQHWLQRLQREGWFGARRVYAWSFYSQGTKEDRQASEDTFLAHALEWFGVQCEPTLSPWDKGRLLAVAVARERTLLILDGIEPLQYPPGPMGGQLRAPGVQSLLKQLARKSSSIGSRQSAINNALCLVTTREPLTDLADFQRREGCAWGSVLRVDLGNLTDEAGAALLHHAGANRAGAAEIKPDDKELLVASREVDGHALTLNLLGRFLARAHGGDIRRRDLVKFEEADRKEQGGTTFKMLAAFENWFANEGDIEARSLAILRLLGLFDRPADAGCMAALRKPPVITGLTEPLFVLKHDSGTGQTIEQPLSDKAWNDATHFLADFELVTIQTATGNNETYLDCHPLIREHFVHQMVMHLPDGFITSNNRIYEHLAESTPKLPGTLETMMPLFAAISHGCHARRHQETYNDVYRNRIRRWQQDFHRNVLGATSDDLVALSHFFEKCWTTPVASLSEEVRGIILNQAGLSLRCLGRFSEAIEPMQKSLDEAETQRRWKEAAVTAGNLSELCLDEGDLATAEKFARKGVELADRSRDGFKRMDERADLADVLHQCGNLRQAEVVFREAEDIQKERQPEYPLLYSMPGFLFCDVLLSKANSARWLSRAFDRRAESGRSSVTHHRGVSVSGNSVTLDPSGHAHRSLDTCRDVQKRAMKTLEWVSPYRLVLFIALDNLNLGRALLLETTILWGHDSEHSHSELSIPESVSVHMNAAVEGLRSANQAAYIPHGLLARAWSRSLEGDIAGARADLDEAWDIAERGSMRLHMADIHLYRARLFFREKPYPWKSPQDDLVAAEKLINDCGYHRRDEELADAKRAILGQ